MISINTRIFLILVPLFINCNVNGIAVSLLREDMMTLKSKLLQNYTKDERPVRNLLQPTFIQINFILHSVVDFDEVTGELTFSGVVTLFWRDEFIFWNPEEHSNITSVSVSVQKVWVPNVILVNSAVHDLAVFYDPTIENYKAKYDNYGNAILWQFGVLKSICKPDIKKYPFDEHQCDVEFMTFGFSLEEVVLVASQMKFDESVLLKNAKWKIQNAPAIIDATYAVPFIRYYIVLKRRPTFVLMNLLLPTLLIMLINIFTFLLPPDSGERVSFSTTVLLTLIVFLTIISEKFPSTSFPTAYLSYFLLTEVFISALATICSIIVVKIHSKGTSNQPVSCTVSKFTTCVLCLKKKVQHSVTRVEPVKEETTTDTRNVKEIADDDDVPITWSQVAKATDKICFCVFLGALIISSVVYFSLVLT